MIKVLHVYKTYLPENFTGIPRVIFEIAESTAPLGVESAVLTTGPQASQGALAVGSQKVHVARRDLHIASTSFSLSLPRLYRALAREADIIHYQLPWPVADGLHLFFNPGKPSLVSYQSDIVKQRLALPFYRPVMHAFLNRVDGIVTTSQNYARTSETLQRFADRIEIIPNGIPERTPPPPPTVARWREQLGEGFFLFVGALRYYKGLPFLIEAARATGLPVVVAGAGSLPAREKNNLPANVRLVGEVSDEDKEALLDLCGAFVFPSHLRSEAFGIALLEAARAGKPMISCEIGTGTSFVNLDQVTGLVISPADPAALGAAMQRLHSDTDMAQKFGRAARERYGTLFTSAQMGQSYANIYRRVLEQHGKASA